jgi:uncharacterized protein (DUF2141 family)
MIWRLPSLAAALAAVAIMTMSSGAARADQVRDSAPTPRAGTAAISGVIVSDESTPQPIRRAQVVVTNAEASLLRTTFTNEAGRFSITGLPAGRYTLTATKPTYLRSAYGARRHDRPGTPITLADGHQMTDITLRMTRGAVLSGRITDENGQPAFGVGVRVMQLRMQNGERTFAAVAGGNTFGESTDDRGQYRFFGLPPGEYAIAATPRAMPGEVRAMTDAEIRAVMQALQQRAAQQQAVQQGMTGAGVAVPPPAAAAPRPITDEDIVTVGYANVYYPGTTSAASATTVTLTAGDERSGVDFSLQLVRTAQIEGVVSVPAGIQPQSVQLMLLPSASAGAAAASLELFTLNRAAPGPDGRFSFNAVPPGDYTISARASAAPPTGAPPPPPPPLPAGATFTMRSGGGAEPMVVSMGGDMGGGPTFWGQTDVSVAGSRLSGVSVSLQPGMTITGRIAFKSKRLVADADLSRVRVMLTPAPAAGGNMRIAMGVPQAQVDSNGTFRITGVTPGRYRLSGVAPMAPGSGPGPGWAVQSAIAKGRDIMDFPLDVAPNDEISDVTVTFSDSVQEVSGSLQDASGRPAPDYTIIVFASDQRYWTTPSRRIRTTRPGTDGRFTVTGLPPGEYLMAAVTDMAPQDANDPSFLEQLVAASFKFTLAEGEKKAQDLRISGGL